MLARQLQIRATTAQGLLRRRAACSTRRRACSVLVRAAAEPSAEQAEAMKRAMAEAMQNPEMRAQLEQMQEAMKKPEVQAQMQQMAAAMQNQQLRERMDQLRENPEFKEMFDDIRQNGPSAMMKYWNDPKWIAKIGEAVGDIDIPEVDAPLPTAAAASAPARPPQIEITNLLEAAVYGDEEAVEDFIAIGKDVNMTDPENRTPLHHAAGRNHINIVKALIDAGADVNALESRGNTALHYAAGYARGEIIKVLMDANADANIKNDSGSTVLDLIKKEPRNPLNQQEDILKLLESAIVAA